MSKGCILAINPGTTTTRCALYTLDSRGVLLKAAKTMDHVETVMGAFRCIPDQFSFRMKSVLTFLNDHLQDDPILACVGRGGMLTPVPSGVIEVNEELVDFCFNHPVYQHASNLGAPLAREIAQKHRVKAFVVDPVSVDELPPVARISGFADISRFSFVHALNVRACGRRLASEIGKPFEELRAVVAHLGAGISVAMLMDGRIVDSSNRMECSPFSPERSGGLPPLPLIELCYSGKYEKAELLGKLYGQGGLYGYLGTKDVRKVEEMVAQGDERARLIYDAMLYQISKAIGVMAAVADFDLDGIVITGGMANSRTVTGYLRKKTAKLAPCYIYPGSDECLALAQGAVRILSGSETAMSWPVERA